MLVAITSMSILCVVVCCHFDSHAILTDAQGQGIDTIFPINPISCDWIDYLWGMRLIRFSIVLRLSSALARVCGWTNIWTVSEMLIDSWTAIGRMTLEHYSGTRSDVYFEFIIYVFVTKQFSTESMLMLMLEISYAICNLRPNRIWQATRLFIDEWRKSMIIFIFYVLCYVCLNVHVHYVYRVICKDMFDYWNWCYNSNFLLAGTLE